METYNLTYFVFDTYFVFEIYLIVKRHTTYTRFCPCLCVIEAHTGGTGSSRTKGCLSAGHMCFPRNGKFGWRLPRCWWSTHARRLAHWMDHYIVGVLRKSHKIREIWVGDCFPGPYHFNENVEFGMLKCDMVHLNQNGNKALIKVCMTPVLHKWKCANM